MNRIKKVIILGSGALKIGEAGEFDYSGTQALKALREEGIESVLVNPNIATIQTSREYADRVYFDPVTPDFVSRIIEKEHPDGIFLSFGGQTALNCGLALAKSGVLSRFGVSVLGTPISAIEVTEDRTLFAKRLASIGILTAHGETVDNLEAGVNVARTIGYPVMVRVGFALGGAGSGVVKDETALVSLLHRAFSISPHVTIEECLFGWKEIEYEVVRDSQDNCITVCNMENFDPVGIHTGESIVVAPSQTLSNREYFDLRARAIACIRELGIVGECNIQYALNPKNDAYRVIEVNARLSRSSALASKATGYPLAYVAAKLALRHTLPRLTNAVTKTTSAFFEPALDYVVVKVPRWDLGKFDQAETTIGSEMKSVGEVMSIARTFEEALQKSLRMLAQGYEGIMDPQELKESRRAIFRKLENPDPRRVFTIAAAFFQGISIDEITDKTGIDPWFLATIQTIVGRYREMIGKKRLTAQCIRTLKSAGFSDTQIAQSYGKSQNYIRSKRKKLGIVPRIKRIDTMAGEVPARTNYLYLTYSGIVDDAVTREKKDRVGVLGSGPYAIGTSVEFDWCAVNAVRALAQSGKSTVLINCNPETVSTDYDTVDTLYFEELSLERVLDIHDIEHIPFVLSVGGQIANNLAPELARRHVTILGTPASTIIQAEDRQQFSALLDRLHIAQPPWIRVSGEKKSLEAAALIGYPVLVRPSFVLSGKAMLVIERPEELRAYLETVWTAQDRQSVVMSKFLSDATECDFDGVAKDGNIVVSALSEHVEAGGVHSGDATLVLPVFSLSQEVQAKVADDAARIVAALRVSGPFNIQFLVTGNKTWVIECNLRASRSFPFVSKVLGVNFIEYAVAASLGKRIAPFQPAPLPGVAVKVAQFSFRRLKGADPVLRVEMSSTGEVAAFGKTRQEAYLKALLATGVTLPKEESIFLSFGGQKAKELLLPAAVQLQTLGYTLYATGGTHTFLQAHGVSSIAVGKLYEAVHPNYEDLLKRHAIGCAIVIPERFTDATVGRVKKGRTDGYLMRRMAIDLGIPIFTNAQVASLFVDSVAHLKNKELSL